MSIKTNKFNLQAGAFHEESTAKSTYHDKNTKCSPNRFVEQTSFGVSGNSPTLTDFTRMKYNESP
jgi:hypothetical protein